MTLILYDLRIPELINLRKMCSDVNSDTKPQTLIVEWATWSRVVAYSSTRQVCVILWRLILVNRHRQRLLDLISLCSDFYQQHTL